MKNYISAKLRKTVATRAGLCCEYCRLHEDDSFLPFEVEHIVSKKHGGGNELSNLAYACPQCNQHKGTDLVTFLESYADLITLFNPRTQS
jgi:5-methylcytosine-specific restriction endonuclease McrA